MDSVLMASNGHFVFRWDFRNAKHLSVVLTNTVLIDDFCKQRRREIHLYIYGYRKEKVSSYPVSQLLFQIHARKTK